MITAIAIIILILSGGVFLYSLIMYDDFSTLCKIDREMPNLFTSMHKDENIRKKEFYKKVMMISLLIKLVAITIIAW